MKFHKENGRQGVKTLPNLYALWREDADDLPFSFDEGERELLFQFASDEAKADGGPGSGNFGHSGRPGHVGGSAKEGSDITRDISAPSQFGSNANARLGYRNRLTEQCNATLATKRNDFEKSWRSLKLGESLKKVFPKKYEKAKEAYDKAKSEMDAVLLKYKSDLDQWSQAVLSLYPNYDSIKDGWQASEYLNAKGYFRNSRKEMIGGATFEIPEEGGASIIHMHPELARSTAEVLDKIYNKYPEISKKIRGVKCWYMDTEAGGHFGSDTKEITYNKIFFESKQAWQNEDTAFHPIIKSKNPYRMAMQVVSHEYGHALDDILRKKYPDLAEESEYNGEKVPTVSTPILRRAAENLGVSITEMKQSISGYACHNDFDAMAEAFSEYITSESPRREAAEIGKQIDSLYNSGKLAEKGAA